MQKNKFIHEDIKAVCNSAVKKLSALGLAVAVAAGGTSVGHVSFAGGPGSSSRTGASQGASKGASQGASQGAGQGASKGAGETIKPLFSMKEGPGFTQPVGTVHYNGPVYMPKHRIMATKEGFVHIFGTQRVQSESTGKVSVSNSESVTVFSDAGRTKIFGDCEVQANGHGNLFHSGNGDAVMTGQGRIWIDGGASAIIEDATRVDIAPGIPVRGQNGTEFTMGATREETIDNLIPDIQLGAHQERDTQPRNLNFNNPRLQRMLAWGMDRFGLSGQELMAFVQRYFIQGG